MPPLPSSRIARVKGVLTVTYLYAHVYIPTLDGSSPVSTPHIPLSATCIIASPVSETKQSGRTTCRCVVDETCQLELVAATGTHAPPGLVQAAESDGSSQVRNGSD